jgi:hypothetical protein
MYPSVFSPSAHTRATNGGQLNSYDDLWQAMFTVLAVIAVLCVLLVVLTYLEPRRATVRSRSVPT